VQQALLTDNYHTWISPDLSVSEICVQHVSTLHEHGTNKFCTRKKNLTPNNTCI